MNDVRCLSSGCEGVERYKVTVEWTRTAAGWDLGAYDDGTHFHLFCSEGHETKCWGRNLPPALADIVYPGTESTVAPEPQKRPSVPYGAPRNPREWDAYLRRLAAEDDR